MLRRTPLYNRQFELGGKFVDFHGWELPIQFSSIIQEHQAVRTACGLFDVSHMGQLEVTGKDALRLMQTIQSNDAAKLAEGRALYAHLLNERGGVVDDVIFSRLGPDRYFIVVNAATAEKDFAWISGHSKGLEVEVKDLSSDYAMLALQGPQAHKIIAEVCKDASALKRFGAIERMTYGQKVVYTRTGYTGEDGFEITAPAEIAIRIWRTLNVSGSSHGLLPCGLGARDTLRLEAGYLLYGTDIDDDHTPLEAGCGWVVKFDKADFIGKKALAEQKREGLKRKLYGVRLTEKGVPRAGASVLIADRAAGTLTSATYSPTLETGIGVGYLDRTDIDPGTPAAVEVRGRRFAAEIVPLPFYKRKRS